MEPITEAVEQLQKTLDEGLLDINDKLEVMRSEALDLDTLRGLERGISSLLDTVQSKHELANTHLIPFKTP